MMVLSSSGGVLFKQNTSDHCHSYTHLLSEGSPDAVTPLSAFSAIILLKQHLSISTWVRLGDFSASSDRLVWCF